MTVPRSIQGTLENASTGMLSKWKVKNRHVVVEYSNGFAEVIWFEDEDSAIAFSNALAGIKQARKLKLGEPYTD